MAQQGQAQAQGNAGPQKNAPPDPETQQNQQDGPDKQQVIQQAADVVLARISSENGPEKQDDAAAPQHQKGGLLGKIEHTLGTVKSDAVTAAEKVVGDGKQLAQEIHDVAIDGAGQAVGVLELGGLKYPVTTYEAQVDSGLYRGSRVDAQQMAKLKEQGIKGIVNLCLENNDDQKPASELGLASLHIPILDNSSPSVAQVWEFINFCKSVAPVYVHCEAGKGRTGTMCAAYRMVVDGWSVDQALAEYKSYGGLLPNQEKFLRSFAATLNGGDADAAAGAATQQSAAAAE